MEDTIPHKARRAAKACAFCRRRKLRCDNEKPACSSCRGHGKECVYTVSSKRPRPSKAQVSRLEAENQQLRQQITASELHSESATTPTETRPGDPRQESQEPGPLGVTPRQPEVGKQAASVDQARSTVSRIFISPNGDSSYHGLTSTLFDDAPLDRRIQMRSTAPQVPVEHIQKRLMGESAYQRQLEMMNMREGKLDFDGVDPELGMHLLSLHWNRQHHSFLITYRPAFMRDMASSGPYFSKLLLNAIYFGASKFSNRPEVRRDPNDVRTAGWTFRMRVKELLGSALDRSEITTIQALLVMTSSLFALGDERSAAWLYAGTAFRMIIDLGLHVDATMLINMRQLSDEDLEIRRRVFWGAFVVDKVQALYQGRPASLQDFDTKVSLSFLDHYEELEHWQPFAYSDAQPYPGSPAYSVSTFTELCKLSLILNGILNKVYSERSSNRTPQELMTTLSSLDAQLRNWQQGLPRHLQFSNSTIQTTPPPHVISLLSLYNVLLILLHRPFVAEGHLHTTDPSVAVSSFTTCTAAANRIINLLQAYDHAFSIRRAPYLISYATYVAATIHVRVAAQREGGSRSHTSLRACLGIFQKNGETNWAVRRAQNVIIHLMDRMGVDLNDQNPGFPSHSQGTSDAIDDGIPRGQSTSIPSIENNISFGLAASSAQETPEIEPSELDMDMIIQSFIRQRSKPPEAQALYEGANSNFLASGIAPFGTPGTFTPALLPIHDETCPQECFDDDMLFGLNGSPWNGVQYS